MKRLGVNVTRSTARFATSSVSLNLSPVLEYSFFFVVLVLRSFLRLFPTLSFGSDTFYFSGPELSQLSSYISAQAASLSSTPQ